MSVIWIVDEHSVYRSGIRELIEGRFAHSRVVESSRCDSLVTSNPFDLVLIDSGNLGIAVLNSLKDAHARWPETRFAMMSTSNVRDDVLGCLSAGFHGFVYKPDTDDELIASIGDLLSGRIYVPRWLADGHGRAPEAPRSPNPQAAHLKLTRRQNEILPLIAQGLSNKEIALHLHIAEGTTKIHTAALLRSLGARNRTEAAFKAAKLVAASIRKPKNHGYRPMAPGPSTTTVEAMMRETPTH